MRTLKHAFPLLLLTMLAILLSGPVKSECLPSAESVKHAFPDSRPLWTKREPGHRGKKCWLATLKRVHAEVASTPHRKIKSEMITVQNDNARLKAVISALVFPAPVLPSNNRFQFDSFNDRFWHESIEATNRPSYVQRLMDPIGVVP